MWWKHPYVWVAAAVAVVLLVRLAGPSDIFPDQEQTDLMHRAADVVLAGRLFLPRDAAGLPPTQPPLLPQLAALGPAVGLWQAWAFKLPLVISGLTLIVMTIIMARRLAGRLARQMRRSFDDRAATWTRPRLLVVAGLAGLVVVANLAFFRYVYQARVEMLAATLLTLAWITGTMALSPGMPRRSSVAAGFWAAVAGCGLVQGWIMALPLVYVVLAARLIHGRWRALGRLGWRWGVPMAVAILAVWTVPAVVLNPHHVGDVMLPAALPRGSFGRPGVVLPLLASAWQIATWMFERYIPWSVAALVALIWMGPRRWLRSPLAQAVLWGLIVLLAYVPVPGKGAGDLLATLPPMACIVVLFFSMDQSRWPVPPWLIGAVAAGMILLIASRELTFHSAPWHDQGDPIAAFADEASARVGAADVVFDAAARRTPVAPLMGRHPFVLAEAPAWHVIMTESPGASATVVSPPIIVAPDQVRWLVLEPTGPGQ